MRKNKKTYKRWYIFELHIKIHEKTKKGKARNSVLEIKAIGSTEAAPPLLFSGTFQYVLFYCLPKKEELRQFRLRMQAIVCSFMH